MNTCTKEKRREWSTHRTYIVKGKGDPLHTPHRQRLTILVKSNLLHRHREVTEQNVEIRTRRNDFGSISNGQISTCHV